MKKEVKTICKKMMRISGIFFIAISVCLVSCSDDDNSKGNMNLISQYDLSGTYNIEINPSFMGNTSVATGTHQAVFTDEGNGVLRLQFGGFNAPPMPFVMAVDVQMKFNESGEKLIVNNVEGKGFFDANVPPGGIDPNSLPPGINIPQDAIQNGLHSNGASSISGEYNKETKQFQLQIDPAVGLPIIVNVKTTEKID